MKVLKEYAENFFLYKLYRRYIDDDIGNTAAALAYYLVFSFFPSVVFISMLLGYANISYETVFEALYGIMPKDVIDIVSKYLSYLSQNANTNILMVSLFFTVYFPIRTVNKVMDAVNKAYNIESQRSFFKKLALMISFTIIFVFSIGCIFVLMLLGENLLSFISLYIFIPNGFIEFWSDARFFAIAGIAFITLSFFYWVVPECKVCFKETLPGAGASVVAWVVLSAGFSFYVERMGKYSLLFGSLGAIVVLILWLYMLSLVLIMGAEINSLIRSQKTNK